jgi:S1-C subfamily serine protease
MSATLRFTSGAWSGRDIALPEPEAKIGRDPALEVVIPAEDQRFVSRLHAAVTKEGDRYVLRDLQSSNGTFVNGARIDRAVLADGDEIQFGRRGPMARFRCQPARTDTMLEGARAGRTAAAQLPPAMAAPREPPSQIVRRLVHEAMATSARQTRRRFAAAAAALAVLGAGAGWAAVHLGVFEGTEGHFRRLADAYQGRVVLVEVGVSHDGRYARVGNGTGFFAGPDGLIVTNKHVVYSHLYSRESACIAQSFRRRGLSYEKALVISVWPGGSEFRQTPTTASGDRGLGYSTDHETLELVVTAPDTLMPAVGIECRDIFGGPAFTYAWPQHALDNHDLAVLKASTALEAIPMAASEPQTDDDVMVLGFPTGTVPLETNRAEPIRRVGNVLRTRDTIQIDAVVLGGNSGGPLIDRNGDVVGVTTRGTAESLNMAIKVEHVRRLLERARQGS